MKTIKKYDNFINEELNFNFLKRKNKIVDSESIDKKTYEDDDLFDILLDDIKKTINPDEISWNGGCNYTHDDDRIMLIHKSGLRSSILVLNINGVLMDINPNKLKELWKFFSKEYNNNLENKNTLAKNKTKKEFTGKDNISDEEFFEIVFDKLKNSKSEITCGIIDNGPYGYITNIDGFAVGVINNTRERGENSIYPTNNLFVNGCGFKMNIGNMKKMWYYLRDKSEENKNNKRNSDKQVIRSKYIK